MKGSENRNMSDSDDCFTDTTASIQDIKNRLRALDNDSNTSYCAGKDNKAHKKGIIKLLLPLMFFAVVWTIIVTVNTFTAIQRDESNFTVTIESKETYASSNSVGLTPDRTQYNFILKNNSKYGISSIDMIIYINDEQGNSIARVEYSTSNDIPSGELRGISALFKVSKNMSQETYDVLYAADTDKLKTEVQVETILFDDGNLISYPYNWFEKGLSSGTVGYFYYILLFISIAISLFQIISGLSSMCPSCKCFFTSQNFLRHELVGKRKGTWYEQKKIKNKKGEVIGTIDELVDGDVYEYKNYYSCSHCGNITVTTSETKYKK